MFAEIRSRVFAIAVEELKPLLALSITATVLASASASTSPGEGCEDVAVTIPGPRSGEDTFDLIDDAAAALADCRVSASVTTCPPSR